MIIKRAKTQGFCFGVAITVKKAEEAIERLPGGVTTLGHVVHNPQMVAQLEAKGLKNAAAVDEIESGTMFVRAHGLPVETFEKAAAKGLSVIDATCPMVTKIHVQAEKLRDEGYKIVVVGDPNHPEVKGTLSHVPGAWCITSVDEIAALPRASRVGVVVQSTWNGPGFADIVRKLSEKYYEVRAVNTICTDTKNRQTEVDELSREVEVMVVVGGKTSANTKHLAELAAMNGARSYHIEGPDELQAEWFAGIERAGLMSGASTPGWLVDQVADRMDALAHRVG
ncbi:4-hydroxy-3-methylbut-2-enyl diphosphate reductase [Vulcanimicrobium alpinum]|uniref:4-hydroxy-3-methylbut-2-enyl diphosphate reductase n=1 Tax=Vulcanimicrobium alpinum TaxID=3016050 RepID=A0AAN2C9L0_UNVUL|nr:4-hydroxy-3-methylbut-2-enyl diphosphate reductase [Vulcanimicrobium alpinum]BDE06131.1 4-hydroxy-3-methylbut-2-enyl diphosphate reductase [Vulcanimicrobium alpinum]